MTHKEEHIKDSLITIQRGKHDKEHPYVMISKKMLRDKDLKPNAKGVLCYLLSLPDNFQVHPRQVAQSMGIGKDQIYTILKELLKLGYAFKRQIIDKNGCFRNVIYEFYEERLPEEERFKENITVSGNPDTVNPDTETQTLKNTYSKEERKKEEPPLTPPKKEKQKTSGGGVFFNRLESKFENLTPDLLQILKETYPGVDVHQQLKEMILWLLANPHRTGTQAFITKWLKKNMVEKPKPKPEEEPFVPPPDLAEAIKLRNERIAKEMKENHERYERQKLEEEQQKDFEEELESDE